jgi:hypothetical protein
MSAMRTVLSSAAVQKPPSLEKHLQIIVAVWNIALSPGSSLEAMAPIIHHAGNRERAVPPMNEITASALSVIFPSVFGCLHHHELKPYSAAPRRLARFARQKFRCVLHQLAVVDAIDCRRVPPPL